MCDKVRALMNQTRLSLVLLLVLTASARGDQASPVTIRVLTYNIHHGEGADGRIDLPRLAEIINGARPDIVALQEVDQGTERSGGVNQLTELERLTKMHGEFGKAMDYFGGGYGVAVLSRWRLSKPGNHLLASSPDREPRTALTVQVRAGERGPVVQFTSTHLDQGRESELRLHQAMSLNELLVHGNGMPSILAGDTNARPDTDVMQLLGEQWINASADTVPPPTGRPRPRGDHVLFRPADDWRVVESTLIDDIVASDHRPLLVVLEWTGKR
jgi:endonuclease/exonuclease/phosphatase family metal-dependent hydrolase